MTRSVRHPCWDSALTPACNEVAGNGVVCDLAPEHATAHRGWLVQGGSKIEYYWPRWS